MTPYWTLASGIVVFLLAATAVARVLTWKLGATSTIQNLNERIAAWWILVAVGVPFLAAGRTMATLLFAALSFLALREFISLTPTRRGDRPALFLAFFVAVPLQFALAGTGWYGLFAVFLPVYGFFVLSAVSTLEADTQHFLERVARIQWAVMVCVYGVSHAPALLFLAIPNHESADGTLLLYYLLIAQISDVMQYVCGKLFGRHKVAPVLSPNKTWEGLVGGGVLASALGAALHAFTPYSVLQALGMSVAVVATGFLGGLVLSAVKRSLGAKDWGYSIPGHGGMLDRLDSIAFSAPIFFHLTRWLLVP